VRAVGERGQGARRGGAGAALDDGEHAGPPVLLGRDEREGVGHDHAAAGVEVDVQIAGAAAQLVGVDGAGQQVVQERRGRLFGGTLGRADAIHLRGDERAHEGQHDRGWRPGARAHTQAADQLVGNTQLQHLHPGDVVRQRFLVCRRPRGDGEHRA
jgi:hypothetical protein